MLSQSRDSVGRRLRSVIVVGAYDGEPVFDPVLLAAHVDMDVGVAEINETLRRDLGVVTRAAAVDDDVRLAVGQQGRSQSVDLVGRNVHRSRKVCVVEIGRSQCLYQGKGTTAGQAAVEFVT